MMPYFKQLPTFEHQALIQADFHGSDCYSMWENQCPKNQKQGTLMNKSQEL